MFWPIMERFMGTTIRLDIVYKWIASHISSPDPDDYEWWMWIWNIPYLMDIKYEYEYNE